MYVVVEALVLLDAERWLVVPDPLQAIPLRLAICVHDVLLEEAPSTVWELKRRRGVAVVGSVVAPRAPGAVRRRRR